MAESSYTEDSTTASLLLRIDQADIETSNLGQLGRFLIIRYKGAWYDQEKNRIASFAGIAQPRNPTETGPRHLEDVVEVMYEQMVAGLEKARGVKTREE